MNAIVFQALPKWDGKYNSTALNISKLLAKGRKVFYVEHPLSWVDVFRKSVRDQVKIRSEQDWLKPFANNPNFIVINPPFIPPINSLRSGYLYKLIMRLYLKVLWNKIDSVLKEFEITEFGYINSFDPVFFKVNSTLPCLFKIYHSVDLIEGEPYIAKHGIEAEKKAARESDLVITTSEPLKDRLNVYNDETVCIPNAADHEHFSSHLPLPGEYRNTNRKKLVYTGNIGLRIDYDLISDIAKKLPDFDVYMIGPKDPQYFRGQKLMDHVNIHFTGPKSYEELPAYIQYADVCFIPFECTDLTYHIYPLKLNEYLSAGKPVISTPFTDFKDFGDLVCIAENAEEFAVMVREGVCNNTADLKEKRIQLASKNTWSHRIFNWEVLISRLIS